MFGIANGFYHLQQKDFDAVKSTLNIKDFELDLLKRCIDTDEKYFKYIINKLELPKQWRDRANKATKLLEEYTGKTFKSKATRAQNIIMTPEEIKTFEDDILTTGYYTNENIIKRKIKEIEDKITKKMAEEKAKYKKILKNAKIELKIKETIITLTLKN